MDGKPTDVEIVTSFLRVLFEALSAAKAQGSLDEAGRGELEAKYEAAVTELERMRKTLAQLHEAYRRTQDDLAELTARYRKVCETIPPSYPGPGRARANGAVRPQAPSEHDTRRDLEKQAALDAALDAEDALTALPLKRTCETCLKRSGGVCQSRTSTHAYQAVGAAQAPCDQYVRRPPPANAPDRPRPMFTRKGFSKGICAVCGHEVCLTRKGTLFSHDRRGRAYRGNTGADKSSPCPGAK